MSALVREVEEFTAERLTAILGEAGLPAVVESLRAEAVGTGQLGSVFRLTPTYAADHEGPETFIAKLASTDAGSRAEGLAIGAYVTEVRFYEQIAGKISTDVPKCYLATVDEDTGWFTLVFEDLTGRATVGDVLAGGTVDQAELALEALVGLQAPLWNSPELEKQGWLADDARTFGLFASFADQTEPFLARFGDRLSPEHLGLIERVVPRSGAWVQSWSGPRVVQHGDYRLDNMMFGTEPGTPAVTIVDWQTARLGPPLTDVAYYLGACLSPDDRRANEQALVEGYHARLVAAGVSGFSLQECWESYRQTVLYGLYLAVGMGVRVRQTERGDAMFAAAVGQYADLALEHGVDGR